MQERAAAGFAAIVNAAFYFGLVMLVLTLKRRLMSHKPSGS